MSETKTYIGTKVIHATPMNRADYNTYRGWQLPADENGADEGFLVEYLDGGKANDSRHVGYISWSPADVFHRAYQLLPEANGSPMPKVTLQDVNDAIVGETYTVLPSGRVTVCELTLKNGFTVRGESGVVFIENNIPELGRKYARERALEQVWMVLGYALREKFASIYTPKVPPHIQRVIQEKADLDEKIIKLNTFTDTKLFADLPEAEQKRLSAVVHHGELFGCAG